MIWATVLSLLLVVAVLIVKWRKKKFSVFKEMGIGGPEPNLIWGNLFEYQNKKRVQALSEWCNTYGDIFGFYNGDVPTLVVKDLDLLQRIYIKDFTKFTDRGCTMRTDQEHPYLGQSIAHAKGMQWKRVRHCVSQGFTSGRLKQTVPHIRHVADLFIEILEEKADKGKEVCMDEVLEGLAMDYIGRAAFGIDNSFQRDLNNPFMVQARETVHGVMKGFFHNLAHCTTTLGPLMAPLLWLNAKLGTFTLELFSRQTAKVVELRKQNPSLGKPDLLQGLIDAEDTQVPEGGPKKGDIKKLSSADVCVNATVLFVAGFETTSVSLRYLTFIIAKYPEIQEKLRAEVERAIAESGELDFTSTMSLKYLNQVLEETMRMYPPAVTFTTRMAVEDIDYDGLKIKAGLSIMSPTYQVHMDSKNWRDPQKFDPERFSPEKRASQHPAAYQPFGIGPRNCVGMRLATLEIMYTAARMLLKFQLELGESQKGEMKMDFYAMMSAPANGPWIKFYKR